MKRSVLNLLILMAMISIWGCSQTEKQEGIEKAKDATHQEWIDNLTNSPATANDFYRFEKDMEMFLNQGHGIGYDVYGPLLKRFESFKQLVPEEDLKRAEEKLQRLKPQSEPEQTQSQEPLRKGLLSPRGCEGEGSLKLTASPMALEDIGKILPMGGVSTFHITPTDHQYWQTPGYDGKTEDTVNLERFKIYAPADGKIVEIGRQSIKAGDPQDYRVIIEHSCTFYTIFIHIDKLAERILKESGLNAEVNQVWLRISVKAGELIGTIGTGKLDFSVVDSEVTLPGFVNPKSYEGEPWKIHTVDTFDYYEEPQRSQLLEKNVRTKAPLGGKIDYDIPGKLIGNWFKEGTNGHRGLGNEKYWATHLSIVYDSIDTSHITISIGNFSGREEQFGVKGNTPDPAEVGENVIVKYELVPFDYYTGVNKKWNGIILAKDLEARNGEEIRGTALFQLMPDGKLKTEFFPAKKASEVQGFTPKAMVYER